MKVILFLLDHHLVNIQFDDDECLEEMDKLPGEIADELDIFLNKTGEMTKNCKQQLPKLKT